METEPSACQFCRLLAAGPLAASVPHLLLESDQAAAALNRRTLSPGHVTVILKRHHARTSAMRDGDWTGVGSPLGKFSAVLESRYAPHRVILLGDGKPSSHLHLHLIPEPAGATLAVGEAVADLNQAVRPPTLSEAETAALVGELRAALA